MSDLEPLIYETTKHIDVRLTDAVLARVDVAISSRASASDWTATLAGNLDSLRTRLSATWAAKVDTLAADWTTARSALLDVAISSRASAADWTSTLAGNLDSLRTRLSATWAAKVDTLAADWTTAKAAFVDAAISSRASAADWTAARALLLIPVPTSIPVDPAQYVSGTDWVWSVKQTTTSTTYVAVVSVTGAGVLLAALAHIPGAASANNGIELYIDGVLVQTQSGVSNRNYFQILGGAEPVNGSISHETPVRFTTGFEIRGKVNSGLTMSAYAKYFLT